MQCFVSFVNVILNLCYFAVLLMILYFLQINDLKLDLIQSKQELTRAREALTGKRANQE